MAIARASLVVAAMLALVRPAWGAADAAQAAAPAVATNGEPLDLGTLFTTPDERARLDRLRRGEPVQTAHFTGQRAVTGYVKRSDGRSTVWIDGVPLQVATPKAGPLLEPGAVRNSERDDSRIRLERRPAR
jgi:hypothetical protein